jgi:hypothetical protein
VTVVTVIVVIAVMQGGERPRDDLRPSGSSAALVVNPIVAMDAAAGAALPSDAAVVAEPVAVGAAVIDAAAVAVVPADAEVIAALPSDASITTAVQADAAVGHTDQQAELRSRCEEARTRKKWQDLLNCAHALEAVGGATQAIPYRKLSVSETKNEALLTEILEALGKGAHDDALRLLKLMSPTSVYYPDAEKLVSAAKAPAPVAVSSTTTPKVLRPAVPPPAAMPPAVPPPVATSPAATPTAATPTATTPPKPAALPVVRCDPAAVDELVSQAASKYSEGYSGVALSLIQKAVGCQQNVRLYRFAATYACAAHDFALAKVYFNKVPQIYQAAIQQKCQQESIDLGLGSP